MDEKQWIAHRSEDGRTQTVAEHLQNTAELAGQFGEAAGMADAARQAGQFHDVGKYQDAFQKYIRGQYHGRVDHSTPGAVLLMKRDRSWGLAGALCVAGHHAGLPDVGTHMDAPGSAALLGRLKKGLENTGVLEACEAHLPPSPPAPFPLLEKTGNDVMEEMLVTRMLFSCLVDADFLDTERFMANGIVERGTFASIPELHDRFFIELERQGYFSPKNRINEKRCEILRRCIEAGKGPEGLYSLTVPTGGGKTVSSLAFALTQAVRRQKRRIIYVIPYLSIIEQTADVFRAFLGEDNVLECHSNVDYDDRDETAAAKKKLASENWDAPVILTTSEQFWESLYSNRTSRCRKLHNIAQSVILFDEAQMLPRDFLRPCLKALDGLATDFGCSAVLCSATQPHLEQLHALSRPVMEIMEHIPELYEFFRRVRYVDEGLLAYDAVAEAMMELPQALCIASTKAEAREIADRLEGDGVFYLSTNLCPAHRRAQIRAMKDRLVHGLPCHVAATSVISVGVDIDFPAVYLEKTGVDSLIQGAGRCNREGKRPLGESIAHLFETEKSRKSRFMKTERELAEKVIARWGDISLPAAIRYYFDELYGLADYGEHSALDKRDVRKLAEKLAYREIGRVFHLIEDQTKPVLIPWNEEAQEIIRQLQMGVRTRQLLRRAAQYMVNVSDRAYGKDRPSDFASLIHNNQAELLPGDAEMAVLTDSALYDAVFGLTISHEEGLGIEW